MGEPASGLRGARVCAGGHAGCRSVGDGGGRKEWANNSMTWHHFRFQTPCEISCDLVAYIQCK